MLYLACTTVSSVDLAQYGVSLAKDWVSVECGTMNFVRIKTAYITNTTSIFMVIHFYTKKSEFITWISKYQPNRYLARKQNYNTLAQSHQAHNVETTSYDFISNKVV